MDYLQYLNSRIKSELELPTGIQLNPDGIVKPLRILAKEAPFAKFENTAQVIRGVLKQSINKCLRNGFIQAIACDDFKTASKCMKILQNNNNLDAVSSSLASNSSCLSDNGSIRKNVSSLPNGPNQGNKLDVTAPVVRTDCSNHLAVINETEEKTKGKGGYDSEQVRNRRRKIPYDYKSRGPSRRQDSQPRRSRSVEIRSSKRPKYYPSETSPSPSPSKYRQQIKSKRGKTKASFSDSEVVLDSAGYSVSPERPRNYGKAGSGKRSKVNRHYRKLEANNRLYQRSESEDSDELFRPPQSKKLPLERKRSYESSYKQSSSRRNRAKSLESSDVDSSPHRMPRKADFQGKRIRKQRTCSSESEQEVRQKDYDRAKFIEKNKRLNSKNVVKPRCSDSDIPIKTKNKPLPSKSKHIESTDSESESHTKRSKTVKSKSTSRRRISTDYESQGPSPIQDSPPRRSRSLGTKNSKHTKRYPSESSLSPSPSKSKQPVKPKRVSKKTKTSLSDSEVVLDSTSKAKSTRSNKNSKESEPHSAKSKRKVTDKSDVKKVNKPPANKGQTKAGKSNEKPTVSRKRKSVESKVEEKDQLPHVSTEQPGPSASNHLKFMSKLKVLESSILGGTPDPLPEKQTKGSKKSAPVKKKVMVANEKTQEAAKKGKNCKTQSKSPVPKAKQKPSASKVKAQKSKAETKTKKKPINTKPKKAVAKGKGENKNPRSKTNVNKKDSKENKDAAKDDKTENKGDITENSKNKSLLSSDESSLSDSELGPPLSSLSTCLNSIKKQMPRQVGTATPPLRIFLSTNTNSEIMSDISETSSFDKVPIKLDDKNVVKRMAKANKPKQIGNIPSTSKFPNKVPETPENLRKMAKINKKFEGRQDSDLDCSSFSEN